MRGLRYSNAALGVSADFLPKDSRMNAATPKLIDVLSPPANPWLQTILNSKSGDIPPWVHVVRFDEKDEEDKVQ